MLNPTKDKTVILRTAEAKALFVKHEATVSEAVKPLLSLVGNLADRWDEEKEYEDFKEYASVMSAGFKKVFPSCKIIKAHKRGFGISFMTEEGIYYRVKATKNEVGLARESTIMVQKGI